LSGGLLANKFFLYWSTGLTQWLDDHLFELTLFTTRRVPAGISSTDSLVVTAMEALLTRSIIARQELPRQRRRTSCPFLTDASKSLWFISCPCPIQKIVELYPFFSRIDFISSELYKRLVPIGLIWFL
jgi:hypothetical protein